MRSLKKLLIASLSLVVFGTAVVACGGTNSSSSVSTNSNSTSNSTSSISSSSSVSSSSTISTSTHTHSYGDWEIVNEPTMTTVGKATKSCDCGLAPIEQELPVLTDTTVWTVTDEKSASCTEDGYITYSSIYGDVTLTINATDHTPGEWNITTAPTFESVGKAERDCEKGDNPEEQELPVLTDTEFWSIKETVEPDCENAGYTIYTSTYGDVRIDFNAKGHNFGDWVIMSNPTMGDDSKATITRECLVTECGEVDTREVNAQKSFDTKIDGNPDNYSSVVEVTFGSNYAFILNSDNEWVSNNAGVDNSSASMSFTPSVDGTLLFDVTVSSESGWDTFNYDGKTLSGEDSISVSIDMVAGLTYQISYSKDSSGRDGDDNAIIKNLRYSPAGVADGVSVEYYVLSFDVNGGSEVDPIVGTNSTNIDCMPENPTKEGYKFSGWYLDTEFTNQYKNGSLTSNTTVYAKWVETRTITLVLNNDSDNQTMVVTVEEIPEIISPKKDGYAFGGWYTTSTFEEGTKYIPTLTTTDITLYAKWNEAPSYSGTYFGYNIYGESTTATQLQTLTIDPDGVISGHRVGQVIDYNEETGVITWKTSLDVDTQYYMYYMDNVIVYAFYEYNSLPNEDIYILTKENISSVKNIAIGETKANRIVEFTTNEVTKIVYINGSEIYVDVELANMQGDAVNVIDLIAKTVSDLIIKDKNGNVVGEYAKTGSTMLPMDGNQGTYIKGEETLVLNGVDKATLNDEEGKYEIKDGYIAVYVNNTYYEVILDKDAMTYEIEKPMVTIEFDAGEYANVESLVVNKNIEITLPEPTNETYVFRGWYLDENLSNEVSLEYLPTESLTLYAKWDQKISLTIVYGNGLDNMVLYYGNGDITEPVIPSLTNGLAFEGWYLDDTFQTPYEVGQIYENTTIYCNWKEAHAMYGNYAGLEIYFYNVSGTPSLGSSFNISIDADGNVIGSSSHTGTITDYNPETGVFNLAKENSYNGSILNYYGIYDVASGMIAYSWSSDTDTLGTDYYIIFPCDSVSISGAISYWDSSVVLMTATLNNSTEVNVFIFNDKIYYDVTFTSSVEGVTAGNASTSEDIKIFDSTGSLIAEFAHDGTSLKYLDGNQGTYIKGEETLVLNGVDKATLNDEEGKYEIKDGYIAVYVNNTYYEVILDKDAMTYEIEKPMVTIEFDAGEYANVESLVVNKNIEITLPEPTNETHVFRGWYLDENFSTQVSLEYIPTESLTLYAKWVEKVTLTIVYGNGLENVVLDYAVGDITNPEEPNFTNNLAFEGWYLDDTFQTPYEVGEIYENTTIYCNWQGAVAYCGTYSGVNVYGNTTSGSTIAGGTWSLSLVVDANGNVSGHRDRDGKIIEYDALTGEFILECSEFRYNGYYDAENGVLVYAYSSGGENMGYDIFIFFKDATSVTTGSTQASYWNSGYTKLMTFNISEDKTVDVLFYNDKVYYDVTFTSTTEGVTTANAYTADDLVVYDSDGNTIVSFIKGANGLEVVEN